MSYDDRYSRYGDSRIDDYWHHRYRQIDAEYAAAEAVRQTELDRWDLDIGRQVAPDRHRRSNRVRPAEPARLSRSEQIQEIYRYFERAQTSIKACIWLDESVRESWLTRLRSVDLLDDNACDELNTLHDDVERYGEEFSTSPRSLWSITPPGDVRLTLLNVATDLTLLASACLQLQWIR